jgi:hypothetical protein
MSSRREKVDELKDETGSVLHDASLTTVNGTNAEATAPTSAIALDLPPATVSPFTFSSEDIRKVDAAVQRQLRLDRTTQGRMTFDNFYALRRKIELEGSQASVSNGGTDSDNLQQGEQLLHEFLCALSPQLYKIYQATSVLHDNKPCWFLESLFLQPSTSRQEQLNQLLQARQAHSQEVHEAVLAAILSHRSEKELRKSARKLTARNQSTMMVEPHKDALIRQGMTIDERVQARATAKRSRNEDIELGVPDATTNTAFLVQLANGLWQHSNHILSKRQRMQSPTRKHVASPTVTMTLKDAVVALERSLSFGSNAMTSRGEKVSKRQLVSALQELCRLAPTFIDITAEGSSQNGELSKHSTVCLNPSNFRSARARFVGQEPILSQGSVQAVDREAVVLQTDQRSSKLVSTPPSKHSRPAGQLVQANELQEAVSTSTPRAMSTGELVANPIKTTTVGPRDLHRTELIQSTKNSKRAAAGEPIDNDDDISLPSTKKTKGTLRINPNLILSYADHMGGEVLDLTPIKESPRGLKTLFDQMKAGERI